MEDDFPQQATTTDSDMLQTAEEQAQGAPPALQDAETVRQSSASQQHHVAESPQLKQKTYALH